MTCVKLGRGRSSRMMRAHSASPLNSGNKSGIVFSNLLRSEVGNERIAFEAETTINRKDYGLHWNAALETGGFLVGDDVKISLSLQAVPKKA